ncbi:kelch-like protein 5 isoform X3 [Orbicella faveolata]|uniref:kelch-like protein 5 isoform X3 n=1 Tax=Orbicella faveolata TaxID=48498 RepID=UPI0009E25AC5|nr:kelch-like protein 5 isoform X3 [Orbicella faveolata]
MVAHSEILLSKCAQFRDDGQFIDVRLKVREDIFPAHRIVLAANSDYFYAMFTDGMKESSQEVIELKDESISPDAFKIVMDSIYAGDICVNEENVFEVLAAADHLQVTTVVQQCCDFLKREFIQLRLDLHNYCLLSTVADRHSLRDLQEAAENKMASMYVDVCESEEFLSNVSGDQLFSLLSRDDLSAPSETFIFKSVMQWIKHKKEERMAVAAKVIGAVRLGLVDIRVVIEELDTEEMKRVSEIYTLMCEALIYNFMPSRNPKFAVEKTKTRSTSPVLIAVLPQAQMQYFDVRANLWKPLASTTPSIEASSCYCAAAAGNNLYVAAFDGGHYIYRYDTERNVWEKHPHSRGVINNLCIVDDYMYAISSKCNEVPQRYSFAKRQWQTFAKVSIPSSQRFFCSGATVLNAKLYVLYGRLIPSFSGGSTTLIAVLHCFDPVKNEWKEIASLCGSHFGSSLFVVNNILYVAGGNVHIDANNGSLRGNPALVEVYDEEKNTWSVVEQKHIPPGTPNALEIEGKVYFIINKFPVDSGVRIPPGELYPVHLGEWENLAQIDKTAVLCYLPVKRESLKSE